MLGRVSKWRGAGSALFLAALGAIGPAQAQQRQTLISQPTYGTVRQILGSPLIVATPDARCPAAAVLEAGGPCFDRVIAFMRARALTTMRAVATSGPVQAGQQLNLAQGGVRLYDVVSDSGVFRAVPSPLARSSIRVPGDCYALPGEDIRYQVVARDNETVAQEYQIVVCGGAAQGNPPYQPQGTIPASPPAIGAEPQMPGQTYQPTGYVVARGTPREVAYVDAACDPAAIVRDGMCYAGPLTLMAADPRANDIDVIGVRRPIRAGERLTRADTQQTVLKRRRDGFRADRRLLPRFTLTSPEGCRQSEEVAFDVVQGDGRLMVVETSTALCGAPGAPAPMAIYERYGNIMALAEPAGGCPPEMLMIDDRACFAQVKRYMEAIGVVEIDALVLHENYQLGTRVHSHGQVRFDYAEVTIRPDGTLHADRKRSYSAGIQYDAYCHPNSDFPSQSSGTMITTQGGFRVAQAYAWVGCDVR